MQEYTTDHATGIYERANKEEDINIAPVGRALIGKDLFIERSEGDVSQIRPGSALTIKNESIILNSRGMIDL